MVEENKSLDKRVVIPKCKNLIFDGPFKIKPFNRTLNELRVMKIRYNLRGVFNLNQLMHFLIYSIVYLFTNILSNHIKKLVKFYFSK